MKKNRMDHSSKKRIKKFLQRYVIDTLSFMALGLFASLIIGLILRTAGEQFQLDILISMGQLAIDLMGPAIGVAIAYGLKSPPLAIFASAIAGAAGASSGGPAGALVASVIAAEAGRIISGKTRIDIILVPLATIAAGYLSSQLVGVYINEAMLSFGELVNWSVGRHPLIMGILVASLMGIALTAPISSAAIAIMIGLDGLAAGAATVGCSAQMVGFAVSSFRENGWSGVLSQGIGTSMLQIANAVKNPLILLPPITASVLLAPLATMFFLMENTPEGAGMGTSGFVGQIFTFSTMGFDAQTAISVLILHVVGPALICWIVSEMMRKKAWITFGDMKIQT
jgi:uncharacterized membrane protein